MAKRFIDTKMFTKSWFRKLQPRHKLFWLYLLGNCDYAGFWDADIELASFQLGIKLNSREFLKDVNGRIKVWNDDGSEKWCIVKYIEFQYGELDPNRPIHRNVINLLEHHLQSTGSLLAVDCTQVKEKEEVKEKVKEKEYLNKRIKTKKFKIPTIPQIKAYMFKQKINNHEELAERFFYHYQSNGWKVGRNKMVDWKSAVITWKRNDLNTNHQVVDAETFKKEVMEKYD